MTDLWDSELTMGFFDDIRHNEKSDTGMFFCFGMTDIGDKKGGFPSAFSN